MRLGFPGAAGEVTGSCTPVETGDICFLVDCGTREAGRIDHLRENLSRSEYSTLDYRLSGGWFAWAMRGRQSTAVSYLWPIGAAAGQNPYDRQLVRACRSECAARLVGLFFLNRQGRFFSCMAN